MAYTNPIFLFFKNQIGEDLEPSQEELILNAWKREYFKRKELLFRQGDSNTRHYIIEKGLLRLYLIDPNGKEINILFARENQVIGDLGTPEATNFYLGTVEDSIVYSIDEEHMRKLFAQISDGRNIDPNRGLRRSYIHIQKRLVSILANTAEENYLEFRKQYPDLVQRLPQYHIASYLGITPEFLSKIIAKTVKKT